MAIPTRDALSVESTLVGEEIAMGISADLDDQLYVIGTLTDMYEDPIMAGLREYACNAWDAHVEAGFAGPIDVHLPTGLSPTLRIRDYGNGLSLDELREHYAMYGKSSKRGTNDATGMLGIGCKSGLAYTSQFTVRSVKDGLSNTVSITREESGQPKMMVLVRDEPTQDANGTEVAIPVGREDYGAFEKRAMHLFKFWEAGRVRVDGQEPPRIVEWPGVEEVTPGELYLNTDADDENDWIVMGGIPYPVDFGLYDKSRYGASRVIIAFVPIGDVHFTPARESLQQTQRTQAKIEAIKSDYLAACAAKIESEVDSAPNKAEAFAAYWKGITSLALKQNPTVTYKGESIPAKIQYDDNPDSSSDGSPSSRRRYGVNWRRNSDDIEPHQFRILPLTVGQYSRKNDNTVKNALYPDDFDKPLIWVTNFSPKAFNADQRRRLDAYRAHNGLNENTRMILVKRAHVPMTDWMEKGTVWDWNDVRKWRDPNAPKSGGSSKKLAGSYDAYLPGQSTNYPYSVETAADDLPGDNLYYAVCKKYDAGGKWKWLIKHNDKATLVVLPETRKDKFLRLFPHAVEWAEAKFSTGLLTWSELSDEEQALYFWEPPTYLDDIEKIGPERFDDPDLVIALNHTKDRARLDAKFATLQGVNEEFLTKPSREIKVLREADFTKRYPLLSTIRIYGRRPAGHDDHLVMYMNAAYAEHNKEDT